MANVRLKSFTITGFKTIESINAFEPKSVNVLIGPNGAGKSNFISFFIFLNYVLTSKLREYVGYLGGANDILQDGAEVTELIECNIQIETNQKFYEYQFTLMFAKPDNLIFKEEKYRYSNIQEAPNNEWISLSAGHSEANLPQYNEDNAKALLEVLLRFKVFHFYNTSDSSPIRLKWNTEDGWKLKQNGENLGSFLYWMRNNEPAYYNRIVKYLNLILPFFEDFELYDEFGKVLLRWKEKGTKKIFNAGQASDGMLRTIALIALLAQNPKYLPTVLFLDEPELGLHPSAIDTVAGLIKTASVHCQVFIATQSISMVNNFEVDDLVVIDRKGRSSSYFRPNALSLKEYLDEFSSGQLWEKNIIGGRP